MAIVLGRVFVAAELPSFRWQFHGHFVGVLTWPIVLATSRCYALQKGVDGRWEMGAGAPEISEIYDLPKTISLEFYTNIYKSRTSGPQTLARDQQTA